MCLAIPAKLVEIDGTLGKAEVGGARREVDLRLVGRVRVGDYVIIHAGFAIQKLDEEDAHETLSLFREMSATEQTSARQRHIRGTGSGRAR